MYPNFGGFQTLSQAPVPVAAVVRCSREKESKALPGKDQLRCPRPSDAEATGRVGRERGCSDPLETRWRQFSFKLGTLKLTHPLVV